LVDFRGWRLVASSILPIDEATLVYGSNDVGHTIHADSPIMNQKMEIAGKRLNLRGHSVVGRVPGSIPITLYTPVDLEGHIGLDSKYYLVDTARTFPPTTPNGARGCHLYRLFRPEFVMLYFEPLNSDSFSKWSTNDDNSRCRTATFYLESCLIPNFTLSLLSFHQNHSLKQNQISLCLSNDFLSVLFYFQFCNELHRMGINLRYLGLMFEFICNWEMKNRKDLENKKKEIEEFQSEKEREREDVGKEKEMEMKKKRGENEKNEGEKEQEIEKNEREREEEIVKLKRIIMGEMVARCFKNILRKKMRELESINEMDYRRIVIDFFNLVFYFSGEEKKRRKGSRRRRGRRGRRGRRN